MAAPVLSDTPHPAGASTAIGISALIDARPLTLLQLLVAVLCGLAMFIDGYDLQALPLAVPSIARQMQVAVPQFGLALAATTVGLALAGVFLAPLGDRIGRKPAVMAALLIIGASCLLTITATSPMQFALWRFATGLGLGFGIPNCNAWTAEYAPVRNRALILVLMNAAISAGAFLSAFIAPQLITAWGWQGTFIVGGVLPLLLAGALAFAPESLKFLVNRRPRDPRIGRLLSRIAPDFSTSGASPAGTPAAAATPASATKSATAPATAPAPAVATAATASADPPRLSVAAVLTPELRTRTLLLWLVTALNLFILFLLLNWLPTVLAAAGLPAAAALQGTALVQLGGLIGGIALSRFIDRGHTLPALRSAFIIAAVCLGAFLVVPAGGIWNALLLLIGLGVSGAQLGLNALATAYYPSAIKATGMSWVGVVGQSGAFLAPLAGSWLIARQVAPTHILALLVLPALACVAVVLALRPQWQAH